MPKVLAFLLSVIVIFQDLHGAHASAPAYMNRVSLPVQKVHSFAELVKASDLVAYGSFGEVTKKEETSQVVDGRRIVHFIQPFYILTSMKGETIEHIDVLTEGIEPSPSVEDPLNKRFPGAVAEGEYVVFLKGIPGTSYFHLVGGWQGLYPVYEEEVIVLEEGGFKEIGGLTVEEVKKRVQAVDKNRTPSFQDR